MALQRTARALLPRLAGLAEAAPSSPLQFLRAVSTSAVAQHSVHIEDEVYNRQRNVINLGNRVPSLAPDAWVAPSAVVVGDVDLFDRVSIWYGCVLRGDLNTIRVGAFSNIQDRTVVHAARSSPTGLPAATQIGRSVTIGQGCLLRSATVGDDVAIGDRSILLEGSMVEKGSVLAAGTVLPPGRRVPSGELWAGNPAKFVRDLTKDEKAEIPILAERMAELVDAHSSEFPEASFAYVEAEALRKLLRPGAELGAVPTDADADAPGV